LVISVEETPCFIACDYGPEEFVIFTWHIDNVTGFSPLCFFYFRASASKVPSAEKKQRMFNMS